MPLARGMLKVATYNIHGWVGSDGRHDPDRTLEVVDNLKADIIGLQEARLPVPGSGSEGAEFLQQATGMQVVTGPTLFDGKRDFGNVLLSRLPVRSSRRFDLSYGTREPRGALDVDLECHGRLLRVVVTHLGLQGKERHWQVKRLVEVITAKPSAAMVLMGDFNEWLFFSRAMRRIHALLPGGPTLRTFPARFPLLPLDRVWVQPADLLEKVEVVKTPLASRASDHLPVVAWLALPRGKTGSAT